MAIISIEKLSFRYSGSDSDVLSNIDLSIEEGEYVVICGESGSGKTTLLKMLKKSLMPKGEKRGCVLYDGVEAVDDRVSASDIGYVMQNPDGQIVTDKVWRELSFGVENLGLEQGEMRQRVAETVSYFGIESWYDQDTDKLSGGQKQILNLASIIAMRPRVLLLDEPTSQLDPIAATDFLSAISRLHSDYGMTIIMVEHRLDDVFAIADKVVYLDAGRVIASGSPHSVCSAIFEQEMGRRFDKTNRESADKGEPNRRNKFDDTEGENESIAVNGPLSDILPTGARVYNALHGLGEIPLNARQLKEYISQYDDRYIGFCVQNETEKKGVVVECRGLYYRYERKGRDILKGLDMTVYEGEIYAICGGNGSGKTTLLRALCNVGKNRLGSIKWKAKKEKKERANIGCVSQNPEVLFVKNTLRKDYIELIKMLDYEGENIEKKVSEVAEIVGITHLLDRHPLDLSGGELQKAAIAKILLISPDIVMLDEPTKGLDRSNRRNIGELLKKLTKEGKTVIVVSHDLEFCAEYADRIGYLFDGKMISETDPVQFFSENHYYTTVASRATRGKYRGVVTESLLVELCQKNGVRNGEK